MWKELNKNSSEKDMEKVLKVLNEYSCSTNTRIQKLKRYLTKMGGVIFYYITKDYKITIGFHKMRESLRLTHASIKYTDKYGEEAIKKFRLKVEHYIIKQGIVCYSRIDSNLNEEAKLWWDNLLLLKDKYYTKVNFTCDDNGEMRWTIK